MLWITTHRPCTQGLLSIVYSVQKPCCSCVNAPHNLWIKCVDIHSQVMHRVEPLLVHRSQVELSTDLLRGFLSVSNASFQATET